MDNSDDNNGIDEELRQWAHESNEEFQKELDADYDAQFEPLAKVFEEKGPPADSYEPQDGLAPPRSKR